MTLKEAIEILDITTLGEKEVSVEYKKNTVVTISNTYPEDIKRMNNLENELAAAMMVSYVSKMKYKSSSGSKFTPKKKKRSKRKKTHRK